MRLRSVCVAALMLAVLPAVAAAQVKFGPQTYLGVISGNQPRPLFGDVDGDGLPDMYFQGLRLNVAGGTTVAASGPIIGDAVPKALVDVTGDGRADLIEQAYTQDSETNAYSYFVRIWRGGVTGLPTDPAEATVVSTSSYGAALFGADYNGDGRTDLIGTSSGTTWVLIGDGQGGFTPLAVDAFGPVAQTDTLLVDVNADGFLDQVFQAALGTVGTSNYWQVHVAWGGPAGFSWNSAQAPVSTHSFQATLRVADVDGNDKQDIVVGELTAQNSSIAKIRIAYQMSGGFLAPVDSGLPARTFVGNGFAVPVVVDAADLTGDGRAEILFLNNNLLIVMALNQGSWQTLPVMTGGTNFYLIRTVDWNNDGRLDVIGETGGLFVQLQQAGPRVDAGSDVTVTANAYGVATVALSATVTENPGGGPVTFSWAIGNVQVATGQAPTLALPVGVHQVAVMVTDSTGVGSADVVTVFVQLPAGGGGAVGPQGPAGPQGVAGLNGQDGAPGPQGPQGEVGPAGPQGPQGEAGPVGPPGPAGPAGPQGPQGEAGVAGPQGVAGLNGQDGAPGPIGPIGPQGPQGPVGPQGIQGIPGADGAQGPAGDSGPQGEPGVAGPQGPIGPTGPQGSQGPAGPQGPTGPKGDPGVNGTNGLPGPAGPQGPAGSAVPGSLLLMPEGLNPGAGYTRLGSYKEERVDEDGKRGRRPFNLVIVIWQKQ